MVVENYLPCCGRRGPSGLPCDLTLFAAAVAKYFRDSSKHSRGCADALNNSPATCLAADARLPTLVSKTPPPLNPAFEIKEEERERSKEAAKQLAAQKEARKKAEEERRRKAEEDRKAAEEQRTRREAEEKERKRKVTTLCP